LKTVQRLRVQGSGFRGSGFSRSAGSWYRQLDRRWNYFGSSNRL